MKPPTKKRKILSLYQLQNLSIPTSQFTTAVEARAAKSQELYFTLRFEEKIQTNFANSPADDSNGGTNSSSKSTTDESPSSLQTEMNSITPENPATDDWKRQMVDRLDIIQKQNTKILELLSQKHGDEADGLSNKLFEPLQGFPLKTVEQFDELNTNLKLRKRLFNYLKGRGGTKLREFLNWSLQLTMTDELVSQFTWLGDKKSNQFGDTRVANVLYAAAQKCPYFPGPTDKTQFKTEILEVLRTTKQRFRKSSKKLLPDERVISDSAEVNTQENRDDFESDAFQKNLITNEIKTVKEIENSTDSEDYDDDESEDLSGSEADDEG